MQQRPAATIITLCEESILRFVAVQVELRALVRRCIGLAHGSGNMVETELPPPLDALPEVLQVRRVWPVWPAFWHIADRTPADVAFERWPAPFVVVGKMVRCCTALSAALLLPETGHCLVPIRRTHAHSCVSYLMINTATCSCYTITSLGFRVSRICAQCLILRSHQHGILTAALSLCMAHTAAASALTRSAGKTLSLHCRLTP